MLFRSVRAGRAMQAGVYFVTQSSGDVSKESLKNNIGLKFAFRSTDINEIKQTLEFFGIDKDDENNQKRLRDLENGQCLLQDLYGRVGVVHPSIQKDAGVAWVVDNHVAGARFQSGGGLLKPEACLLYTSRCV